MAPRSILATLLCVSLLASSAPALARDNHDVTDRNRNTRMRQVKIPVNNLIRRVNVLRRTNFIRPAGLGTATGSAVISPRRLRDIR